MMAKKLLASVAVGTALVASGATFWWQGHERAEQVEAKKRLTYKAGGYGGFIAKATPAPVTTNSKTIVAPSPAATSVKVEPLETAREAYAKGDYKQAEVVAKAVIASAPRFGKASVSVASAEHLMAFAAARQGDLKTARDRFAKVRTDAQNLPHVSPAPGATALGEMPNPTLAEDAAYQYAACTMGLGDKAGAERELVQFIKDFPTSPLVHASMRRIAKLHGGDIPKEAESVWKVAQAVQRKAQEKRDRDAAMCGPEAIAELLKRSGKTEYIESLANEAKTDGNGSSLAAMQSVLRQHGFPDAQGVRLTIAGLKEQALPVVALIQPGHFVLVDKIGNDGAVTIWDSGGLAPGMAAPPADKTRTVPAKEWERLWTGMALTTAKVVGANAATTASVENKVGGSVDGSASPILTVGKQTL